MTRYKSDKIFCMLLTVFLLSTSDKSLAEIQIYKEKDVALTAFLNVQAATFHSKDSWFGADRKFLNENTNDWHELTAEGGLSGEIGFLHGTLFGEVSLLFSGTWGVDASGLIQKGDDPNKVKIEQAHIGWKSGTAFEMFDKDALTLKYGNFDYSIGTGMVINDGGGDGGNRGGWWMGARKAFAHSGLISFHTGPILFEAFYLENRTRSGATKGRAIGVNAEYKFKDKGLDFGSSWFRVIDRDSSHFPSYDVYSFRSGWEHDSGFEINGEYVGQSRHNVDAFGWYIQPAFQWKDVAWTPKISYRFAHFSGDDLHSSDDEGFKTTAYGSTDWGQWFQGEIAGNYPLDNSNLDSHMVRIELHPRDDVTLNFIYYNFKLDEKHIFGSPVKSHDFGDEIDLIVDWNATEYMSISGVLGWLSPDDAAKEWTGGNSDWLYSMVYVNFSL